MARLPCTHFGSMRLSQGLLLGNWYITKLQPPECLTRSLCAFIQVHTARLTYHEALSLNHQARLRDMGVVMTLVGGEVVHEA
jgi:hypothetical protein